MKYIRLPRGSGKPDTIMNLIKEKIEKGERFIVLSDMNYLDITKSLEKLRKDRAEIDREIYDLENMKSRKLSEESSVWNQIQRVRKDCERRYPTTIRF
ncbi:hypothetical protein MHB54_00350 [Paenibacillus sp. FSL M7-0802]|uniref:hypothetical protein n=1 Tax=Paenibacillus sp. FSL M7-0802 TaxID=2921536 RepID=UPI0030F77A6A